MCVKYLDEKEMVALFAERSRVRAIEDASSDHEFSIIEYDWLSGSRSPCRCFQIDL